MAIEESKIVRFPEGAQDVPFEEVNYVMAAGLDGKFKRISKNALKTGLTIENGRMQSVDPGALPAGPTGQTRYMEVTAVGTWTYGGAEVGNNAEGYRTTFWWTGTEWVSNGTVRVKGDTPAGSSIIVSDEVPSGQAVIDYVQPIADKFEDDEIENLLSDNNEYGAVEYFNESNTFIGFGFTHDPIQNFSRLKIWHKDFGLMAGKTKVTSLNVRLCEEDMNGAELAYVQNIPISFADGAEGWIDVDSPLIANTLNKPIWVEYWGNGNMACFASTETIPSQTFRWKSTGSTAGKFNVASGSTAFSSTRTKALLIPFYQLETVKAPKEAFASQVLDKGGAVGEVQELETKAVSGDKVYKAIQPFNKAIQEKFVAETSNDLGGNATAINTSTFSGWGQNKGVLKNFNAIGYNVIAYDNTAIPTYIEMRLRDTNESGDVLETVRVNISPTHNIAEEVLFILNETFANADDKQTFVQFNADGRIALTGSTTGSAIGSVKWTPTNGATTTTTPTTSTQTMGIRVISGDFQTGLSEETLEIVKNEVLADFVAPENPDLLLTSRVWLYPTFQYNIFNKNVLVPEFGDNLNNYRLDFAGSVGQQFNRGYRHVATASMNSNITLSSMKGRKVIQSKTQNILSSAVNNGSGVTRNVLIVGDSTVNGSNISTPLKTVFDSDVMNINLIGTLGGAGVKHEGRGGWTINDYYGYGRSLYVINVSGLTTAPSINARYTQGTGIYNVDEVNITGGTGYFSVSVVSGTAPNLAGGTLTKTSGSGDTSITYSSATQTSGNPFYNPSTEMFDLGYYLTNTSQTMGNGDWICFQLGINDVFGITDLNSAVTKTTEMANQMNEIISNIKAYNPNIRVGLVVTFPPTDQDAFGANYTLGQLSEMYTKTGLVTWQKRLISDYDNETKRGQGIYLISAHLNLDTEYNYPSAQVVPNARYTGSLTVNQQNNGVHPAASGYAQIADMYAGAIKYFG